MTNDQLETELAAEIKNERICTNRILFLINLAEERELPLRLGFSGPMDWLVQKYGYSRSAAWRRIESARMLRVVPEAAEKLRAGVLNLTNLTKAHASIKAQEKRTGTRMTAESQTHLVRAIENQTTDEAEITLLTLLPDTASQIHREYTKRIDAGTQRLAMNFSNADIENLAWIRDYLSHAMPDAGHGQILSRLMTDFRRKHSASKAKRIALKAQRRTCEYKNETTGKVCGSTLRAESDHVVPVALGGGDEASNRRCLCRKHNQFEARRKLGRGRANSWRKKIRRDVEIFDASRDRASGE